MDHFHQSRWCQSLAMSKSKGPYGELQGMFVATNHELGIDWSTLMFIGLSIALMQFSQLAFTF